MSKDRVIFDEMTSSETRARCPRVEPTGCQGRKKEYHIQVEPDHAFCHRCQYTWHFDEKKPMNTLQKITPPKVKEPLYTKSSGAVKESDFANDRANYMEHYKTVIQALKLPWNDESLKNKYGIGVRNVNGEAQLVFRIAENHIKRHKGKQFGDAECKIYPDLADIDHNGTLLICEGEKDAISANCYGFPAITMTSGAGGIPKDISPLRPFNNIVICYDADESGRKGAIKLAKKLYHQNIKLKILELPDKMDITDYFVAGNSFHDLYGLIDATRLFGTKPEDFGGDPMYKVFDFMDKFQKKVEYICDEILLEDGRTSVAGGTNVGKSLFALQFGICVAMGVPFMTFQVPKPRRVLLVQFVMMDAMVTDRLNPMVNALMEKYPGKQEILADNLTIVSADKKQLFENAYEKITGNLTAAPEPFDVLIIDNLYTSSNVDTVKNDQLRIFPQSVQTGPKKMWVDFFVAGDTPWENDTDVDYGVNGINNINALPFENTPYQNINSIGKQWIRRFALALAKEMLGNIRSKFTTIPIHGESVTLDGPALISQGQGDQEKLREELKTILDELTYTKVAQSDVELSDAVNSVEKRVPMLIYPG